MPTNVKRRRATTSNAAAQPRAGPQLSLSVQKAVAGDALPATSTLRRWIARALGPGVRNASVTVRFVGRAEGRALNRQYRGRDYATNVLTFIYAGPDSDGPSNHDPGKDDSGNGPRFAGDLVLCVPVLEREAREQKKTLREHCAHLVIHGTLHLQGYDHENDKDATVMEALETRLLAALRYRDPYDDTR